MARCVSPFTKKGENIPLPCGKCYECKARRVSGWSYRLMKEAEISNSAFFITLTYAQPPLTTKGFMTLWKPHVQEFIKRLRHTQKSKIKYFSAGEYGGKTARPHYHILFFNLEGTQEEIVDKIEQTWKLGQIHIGKLNPASVRYCLKYINKGKTVPKFAGDDRIPEFQHCSKGLGANYLTEAKVKYHRQALVDRHFIVTAGIKIAIPRYYKEKLYTKWQRQKIAAILQQRDDEANSNKKLSTILEEMKKEDLIRFGKQKRFTKNIKTDENRESI